ncbi:MAG: UMP kinase [Deltaproteobacteria bacterium RBG_13_52_11]|nr:MAG: UMP kinase [Deltaproteobacteria bacterium RBG_13_52_11]
MKKRPTYKRIVIKLSGEVMAGEGGVGIEPAALRELAEEIKELRDLEVEIAVVIGGGNLIRGTQAAEYDLERVTADQVGMLTTIINGLALRDVLERRGVPTSVQSAVPVGETVTPYVHRYALRDLREGKVVIFVGGTGNPYFTTDTAASLRALEIGAEIILKATKVDGVYDSDPFENPAAVKFDTISYQEVLQRRLCVMDATAISLCMDHQLPLVVFNIGAKGNMRRIILGEKEGTLIS